MVNLLYRSFCIVHSVSAYIRQPVNRRIHLLAHGRRTGRYVPRSPDATGLERLTDSPWEDSMPRYVPLTAQKSK
jgi:hypothetical protein